MKDVTRTPQVFCPKCGHTLNAAGTPDGDPGPVPSEGDVSICIACGQLLMFQGDLTLRMPTKEECAEMVDDEAIIELVGQWMRFQESVLS